MSRIGAVRDELILAARFAAGLPAFLRHRQASAALNEILRRQQTARRRAFVEILRRAVFANPRSPYLALMRHAGVTIDDALHLVETEGVEGALDRFYDAGVRVSARAFKGREALRCGSLELPCRAAAFDNPLLTRHYRAQTGGSRGGARRVAIDLDLLRHEAAYLNAASEAFGLQGRRLALWRPVPPVAVGMKRVLCHARAGRRVARWFSPTPVRHGGENWRFGVFTTFTVGCGRLLGVPLPFPDYVPLSGAEVIAAWVARSKASNAPVVLDTTPSAAMRVCQAAARRDLDIAGTFFIVGSEPFTPAKAERIHAAGCAAAPTYAMAEVGAIGFGCARPEALDDCHLFHDKIAVITRPHVLGEGQTVNALILTTVLPSCPKLMLNVESDDYAILSRRDCGCSLGALGFITHLREIRSYDKLTSEGVTFLGTELLRLLEEVLPARFGGQPTDYQFLEEEEAGEPRVCLLIHPGVGPLKEADVARVIYRHLARVPGGRLMTSQWQQSGTLRVLRREPYQTGAAKILPLHVRRTGAR